MRRPSPALVIATAALFVALSGTAYAATGGNFILGKSNTATSVSSLSNPAGTALSLSSKAGTPPLTVNSSTQVPNLNASLVDGSATSSGATSVKAFSGTFPTILMTGPANEYVVQGGCDPSGPQSGTEIVVYNGGSKAANFVSEGSNGEFNGSIASKATDNVVAPSSNTASLSTIQIVQGTKVTTIVATLEYVSGGGTVDDMCSYVAQAVTNH